MVGRWACRAGTRFCLGCSIVESSTYYFFSSRYTISIHLSNRPARSAGNHAGSPVSKYVSLSASIRRLLEVSVEKLARGEGKNDW